MISEGAIDEKKINKTAGMSVYKKKDNIEAAIKAAEALGCHMINLRADDIMAKK
jgi:hypothetical protein